VSLLRRIASSVLLVGGLLAATVTPASAATTAVGPVDLKFIGIGSGPDNLAYGYAFDSAYYQAAGVGFASNQCTVIAGPYHMTQLPNGFGQWGVEIRCTGEPSVTSSTRELVRYLGSEHASTTWGMPSSSDYHAETNLGKLYMTPVAGTHPLYMCKFGNDTFTSPDVNCEGKTYMTRLGWIYSAKPANVQTKLIRRCRTNGPLEHFDSNSNTCEGQDAEGILGYALL
jgi:hypothetical protein